MSFTFRTLLFASALLTTATSSPLPSTTSPNSHLTPRSYSNRYPANAAPISSNHASILIIVGVIVGIIVLAVLIYSCSPCWRTPKPTSDEGRGPGGHTAACDAGDRACPCPPGAGTNAPPPPAMFEVSMDGRNEAGRAPALTAAQVNAYNGQSTQSINIAEVGRDVDVTPPPYSPPEAPAAPAAAFMRPESVVSAPGRAVGGREGDANVAAPEVRETGVWGRWAA